MLFRSCDSAAVVEEILRKAAAAKARVYPVAAISTSLEGRKLTDFAALQKAGAVALSDDGRPVPTAGMMAVAMERAARLGMPVLSHCEEMTLVRGGIMHEGVVSEELEVPGIHRGGAITSPLVIVVLMSLSTTWSPNVFLRFFTSRITLVSFIASSVLIHQKCLTKATGHAEQMFQLNLLQIWIRI